MNTKIVEIESTEQFDESMKDVDIALLYFGLSG